MTSKRWTTDQWGNIIEVIPNPYEVIEYEGGHKFNKAIVWAHTLEQVQEKHPNATIQQLELEDIFE